MFPFGGFIGTETSSKVMLKDMDFPELEVSTKFSIFGMNFTLFYVYGEKKIPAEDGL